MTGSRMKTRHAMSQDQAQSVNNHARAKCIAVRQRQGDQVSVTIAGAQMHRAVIPPRRTVGGHRFAQPNRPVHALSQFPCVRFGQQAFHLYFGMLRVTKQVQPIVPGQALGFQIGVSPAGARPPFLPFQGL